MGTPVYPNDLRESQIALQKFWEQTGSYLESSVSFSHLTFKDGTLEWWTSGTDCLIGRSYLSGEGHHCQANPCSRLGATEGTIGENNRSRDSSLRLRPLWKGPWGLRGRFSGEECQVYYTERFGRPDCSCRSGSDRVGDRTRFQDLLRRMNLVP